MDVSDQPGRGREPRRGGWWLAGVVALLAAAGVVGVRQFGGAEDAGAAPAERAVPAVVAEVGRGRAEETVTAVGEVLARQAVTITSEVSGRVVEVPVTDGSRVSPGEVIVRLDDQRERAGLAATEARATQARLQFQRTEELTQRNVSARAQLDEQRAALQMAEAEVTQAAEAVERRTIRAPFAGDLGFLAVDPGSFLEPGSAIVQLTTPPPVRLRFRLPSRFLAGLDVGDPVRGNSAAFPGVTFAGRVVTVDPTVDRASRNFTVEAELDDQRGRLRPGLFLDAAVVLSARDDALIVPENAVLFEGPVTYVYRLDEEARARRTPVELGARAAGMVEITGGLREGDRVVVEGVQRLSDGAKVAVREAAS